LHWCNTEGLCVIGGRRSAVSNNMETRHSLLPGQNGTKKLVKQYGERLICVRYRYDAVQKLRHKTVELVVETTPWNPRARNARRAPNDMVYVRIGFAEEALRARQRSRRDLAPAPQSVGNGLANGA
jgi:hypothetical protein